MRHWLRAERTTGHRGCGNDTHYYGAYCRDPEGNKLCLVHAGGL